MGCNLSTKTINSIEARRNDIIAISDIKDEIQLVKFIKLPKSKDHRFKNNTGNNILNQTNSYRSTKSKD